MRVSVFLGFLAAAAAAPMQMFANQIDPALAQQVPAMLQEAQQSGQAKRNLNGIMATLSLKPTGETVDYQFLVMGPK